MFAQDAYLKIVLTVIAVCLAVLTAERLARGKVELHVDRCGDRYNPCNVQGTVGLDKDSRPSRMTDCGDRFNPCYVQMR